jgi:hypothetical protein
LDKAPNSEANRLTTANATQQATYMKLHPKLVWERFVTAIKIDRIPLFDIRYSLFKVSSAIRLAAPSASDWADN